MTVNNKFTINTLNLFVYLFPIAFVFGNLAINIFTLIIIVLGILIFNKNLFEFKDKKIIFFLGLFFVLLFLSTLFQLFTKGYYVDWIKSLLFIRYFLLLLVIKDLIKNQNFNLKYFLFSFLFISSLISIDILIQFSFGQNILGFKPISLPGNINYYSGVFEKELIAGGYILMFSIIGIFGIPIILQKINKIYLIFIFLFGITIFIIALLLSGNRMPSIMFLFFVLILSLIVNKKQFRFHFFVIGFSILLIGLISIYNSDSLKKRYSSFLIGIPNPINILSELQKHYPELEKYKYSGKAFHNITTYDAEENYKLYPAYTGHFPLYLTSLDLIKDSPLIGKGIKSFRNNCENKIYLPNRICENHPHNFILEILNDTGIIGLILITIPLFFLIVNHYRDYILDYRRRNKISNWIYLAIICALIIQFFPLRSSGSFFSTFNSTYSFLLIGLSLGLNELRFTKNK